MKRLHWPTDDEMFRILGGVVLVYVSIRLLYLAFHASQDRSLPFFISGTILGLLGAKGLYNTVKEFFTCEDKQ